MTTNERTEKLKEIMNQGFKTENNYRSNKFGHIEWTVNESTETTGLLVAKAVQNMKDMLSKEIDDVGYTIKEFSDEEYRTFKLMETDCMSTLIEVEVIEWMDANESMIRITYWESSMPAPNDEISKYEAEMIYEAIAQQLEM